jgi:dTDP-4-amino-4,6-dideoxygalactose transaminase
VKVPLFDIQIAPAEREAVDDVLGSGWLTMGPRTAEFERHFAEHLGVAHAVALSSGTAALHLAFLGAAIGPGDEVIVPAMTFVATANAVRYCGGTPVFADLIGEEDFGIDPDEVVARITPRTKAVCAVHYAGYAAPVEALATLCEEHGLTLIEDAAHSPSATPLGSDRKLGGWGLAGAFSFFSNKVLSCGEGGLLATDDDAVAEAARSRRSHAMTSGSWDRHRGHALGYDVVDLGFNYRIDELRAALLDARLPGLGEDIERRRRLVHRYRARLAGLPEINVPYTDAEVDRSSCYIMPTTVASEALRDELRRDLIDRYEVQTSILYPAITDFTEYEGFEVPPLPRTERVARTQMTLPLFPHMTDEEQDWVLDGLEESLTRTSSSRAAGAG